MINLIEADVKNPLHLIKLGQIFSSHKGNDGKTEPLETVYSLNPTISVFFIYNNDKIIGTVAIDEVRGYTGMAHFVIMPAFQGRGFGRQTVHILKQLYDGLVIINKPKDSLLKSLYKGMDYIYSDTH